MGGRPAGVPHDVQNTASGARVAPHLEQYTIGILPFRAARCNCKAKFEKTGAAKPMLIPATLALKVPQASFRIRTATARGGGQKNPRLVATLGHAAALVIKLGEGDCRAHVVLSDGNPEQTNRFGKLRAPAGRFEYLHRALIFVLSVPGG